MKTNVWLIAIIALGLFLRVFNIGQSPPSLYGDELTIALDANSILKTGKDQLGNLLPLTFPMGAGRPAGYVYASVPFMAMFSDPALGVRMLSILSGLGIIILLYILGKRFFSQKVGLSAAFIAAVSPWDIALSRGGFEAHFALFLALLGVYFFVKAKEKGIFYFFSALSFGLTLHTYPTYKVSLVLFLPLLIWYQGIRSRKYFFIGVILFFILGLSALSQSFLGGSEARFESINIFSQEKLKEEILQKINFERTISNLPSNISKYFHNKPVEYGKILIENYLQNFSLDFLLIHGDRNPRHNMATMGEIYLVEIVFIFIGLLTLWQKNKKNKYFFIFLVSWLVLAPIPTAIVDLPHALRSSFMLPPLILISALGLNELLNRKYKILLAIVVLFWAIQFLFFAQKLYFLAPNEYSRFWSYPAKKAAEIALENKANYDYVIISARIDNMEFAYPVYAKISPWDVILQNNEKTALASHQFKKFDNVFIGFIPDGEIDRFINSLGKSVMYIGNSNDKQYLQNFETVYGLDLKEVLVIIRS